MTSLNRKQRKGGSNSLSSLCLKRKVSFLWCWDSFKMITKVVYRARVYGINLFCCFLYLKLFWWEINVICSKCLFRNFLSDSLNWFIFAEILRKFNLLSRKLTPIKTNESLICKNKSKQHSFETFPYIFGKAKLS